VYLTFLDVFQHAMRATNSVVLMVNACILIQDVTDIIPHNAATEVIKGTVVCNNDFVYK